MNQPVDPTILTEPHRPTFHFTPPSKWMNDPNGMFFYEGEYHLFYQYYPEGTTWGPMHWGHAVTKDLVTWEHLPIALYPDSLGYIFSGSAVVDHQNTSGFGIDGEPPIVALYTYHDMEKEQAGAIDYQSQALAYSNDRGRTWVKYEGNPVLPNLGIRDFRDPKVIWDADSKQWVMVLAAWDEVQLFGSPNLKEWNALSSFGKTYGSHAGVWECPDLFPMIVEETGEKKWVLLLSINPGSPNGGSGTQYYVGDFDGTQFILDPAYESFFGMVEAQVPDEGVLFADFEDGYGDWTIEGAAFGEEPARGALPGQEAVTGYNGDFLVNSFYGGDQSTGKLTSPRFKIEQPFINFLIGGGNDKLRTAMHLVIDGKPVRSAAGANKDHLNWTSWEVSEYIGQEAHLEIVDTNPGGWGHILVDHIVFANERAVGAYEKAVWLDYGRDNYAGVTWSNIPESDGRHLFIGWMSNWDYAQVVPTKSWRSAMTIPRSLSLRQTPEGLRLFSQPVKELETLRGEKQEVITPGKLPFFQSGTEMIITFQKPISGKVEIELMNALGNRYAIGYDADRDAYYSDRRQSGKTDFSTVFASDMHIAPRASQADLIQMHLFFDRASVELFADGGLTCMTDVYFPEEDFSEAKWFADKGVRDIEVLVYELKREN